MLDRLPTEVLGHVLTSFGPPDTSNERQTALYRCCLVSKRILAVAQSLLWRVARLESAAQVNLFAGGEAALLAKTKVIVVEGKGRDESAEDAEGLARLPEVDHISCVSHRVDAKGMDKLFAARRLDFSCGHIAESPLGVSFGNLTILSLAGKIVFADLAFADRLFTATSLPNLRVLFLNKPVYLREGACHRPFFSRPFLEQLEALDDHTLSDGIQTSNLTVGKPPILKRGSLIGLRATLASCPTAQHLLLAYTTTNPALLPRQDPTDPFSLVSLFRNLRSFVVDHPSILSLWLPAFLRPTTSLPPAIVRERDDFLLLAGMRGIFVGWTRQAELAVHDNELALCTQFWDYAKGLKQKREGDKGEGEAGRG